MELGNEKRVHFLYRLFCPKEIFFNICILSQCIVYWTHFQIIHTFTYRKTLLHTLFCLFLKSSKAFSVSLRIQWRLICAIVIRCSTLQLWVGCYFIYFEFSPVFFWWMFFNSVKEINRLRKERNRLISKGMSNIYLKVIIEENWHSQNFDFLSLKNLSPGQFLRSFNSRRYHWILKLCVAT